MPRQPTKKIEEKETNKLKEAEEYFPFQKFPFYFEKDYAKRPKEWCYAFRVGLRIKTNIAVESMHRVIKHDYMKGKINKRLDKAIYLVLQYLDDKEHDQTNIKSFHCDAVKMTDKFEITSLSKSQFIVQSKSIQIEKFTVSFAEIVDWFASFVILVCMQLNVHVLSNS